jgi:hypothetical protein
MAKADLIAKAQELGVTLTGQETVAQLQEIIKAVTPPVEDVQSTPEAPKVSQETKTSFDVHNRDGGFVRTYSVELHGEDAEKLANQYAGKIGGKVI